MVCRRRTPLHHGGWRATLGGLYGPPRSLEKTHWVAERYWEGRRERVKVPYAKPSETAWEWNLSTAGHVQSCWKLGGPPPKAKYETATDSG